MKEKKAIIADNPFSRNIGKILKYQDGATENDLRNEAKKISDRIKNKFPGKSIGFEIIVQWALAKEGDPTKARRFAGLDKLSLFAEAVGVNYWELFIPGNYIDTDKLSPKVRDILSAIARINNEQLVENIQNLIIATIEGEAQRINELKADIFNVMGKPKGDDSQ